MLKAVTVTVGRNVGEAPMSSGLWDDFRTEIRDAVSRYSWGVDIFTEEHTGLSRYEHHDGTVVLEESAKIAAVCVETVDLDGLQDDLSEIAAAYGQEAIALTYGPSVLVQRDVTATRNRVDA